MRSRKSAPACWTAALLAAMASLSQAADLTSQEQKLIAVAKREGAATFSARASPTGPGGCSEKLSSNAMLTDPISSSTICAKARERSWRKRVRKSRLASSRVDVVLVNTPSFFDEASKRGAFEPLESANWKHHEELISKVGIYFNYLYVVGPYASTLRPVWNSSCPGMANFAANSYDDVVKPELRGKTIASDITKSFAYANMTIGIMEAGVDLTALWDKLKTTDPVVEFRTEPKLQMIFSCQRPLDVWNLTGRVYQTVLQKPDLAKVLKFGTYEEGQVMLGNQAAVLKGASHPNAGKLLIEFMLSKEGTDTLVEEETMYSFLKDYKPPAATMPYLFDMSTTKLIGIGDWVAAQGKFEAVRAEWQRRFQ